MSGKLTRSAYERLIEEDIACVLAEMAPSLERIHVVDVLRASPSREYDAELDRLRARDVLATCGECGFIQRDGDRPPRFYCAHPKHARGFAVYVSKADVPPPACPLRGGAR